MRTGALVFLAGHTPRHPRSGAVAAMFAAQARQTFENLAATAEAAGGSLRDLVRLQVYLQSLDDFAELNTICNEYLTPPYPARTTIEAGLRGILVEFDGVLALG